MRARCPNNTDLVHGPVVAHAVCLKHELVQLLLLLFGHRTLPSTAFQSRVLETGTMAAKFTNQRRGVRKHQDANPGCRQYYGSSLATPEPTGSSASHGGSAPGREQVIAATC